MAYGIQGKLNINMSLGKTTHIAILLNTAPVVELGFLKDRETKPSGEELVGVVKCKVSPHFAVTREIRNPMYIGMFRRGYVDPRKPAGATGIPRKTATSPRKTASGGGKR